LVKSIELKSYLDLSKDEEEHAIALHRESVVIDASIVPFIDYVGEDIWLDDVLRGGVTATNATVCMQRTLSEALREVSEYHSWAEKKAEKALIVRKASDIDRAKEEGRHGVILGPQDSSFVEGSVDFLKVAHDRGIRIIQLTYNSRNEAGDGCVERCDAGLSNFGVSLVEAMNELGVLIDLSHVGDKSTMEAIEISKDPVSFTHAIPRSSTPKEMGGYAEWASKTSPYGGFKDYSVARGRTDEALQACAEKGGVLGVTPFFAKKAGPSTLTDDMMDQIDHTVDLIGADHVGFGSDLDFRNSVTRGAYIWKHPDRVDVSYYTPMDETWGYGWLEHMPNLARGLVARGYSDDEIKGILGGNFLRLFRKVWGE
jgi:membrane dipeptidase